MLCAVKLRVLGLMAYWCTGSAFHQIPQSYSIRHLVTTTMQPTAIKLTAVGQLIFQVLTKKQGDC